jgi:hypothetical protein
MQPTCRVLLLFSLMTGCLPGPAGPRPGAVPTGERLAVVDDVRTWTTTYQEKTGETEYKNASGDTVGTAEHYRERTQLHAKKIWYPVQGRQQINDEDFFRFTGNQRALQATEEMHAQGRMYAALGVGGMVVGIAAMVAARFVGSSGAQLGLYTGGGLLGTAGAYGFWHGWSLQSPDSHAVDRSIGEVDAARYNDNLRRGVSLSVGRSF